MERLLRLMATLAIVSCARPVLQARVVLTKTTLLETWRWGIVALGLWAAAWLLTDFVPIIHSGPADQIWLAAAVVMVTPFVAALGARRPGSRIWTWFIVLPVMVVLFLPAVTAWNRDLRPTPMRLESPMLVGYGLVLLMGAGNYWGTRFALAALLVVAACVSAILPMSALAVSLHWPVSDIHAVATMALSLAVWVGAWRARGVKHMSRSPLDRVWSDFRDFFGIVWARRVLDRVNDVARREDWPVRLQFEGFTAADPTKPAELTAEQSGRIEQLLRWLLRRFVDSEWFDERTNAPLRLQ